MRRTSTSWSRWLLLATLCGVLSGCGYVITASVGAILGTQRGKSGGVVVLFAEDADLVVSRGPQDVGNTTEGKGVDVVAAQLRLTATKATVVNRITITSTGSGNDAAITQVRLHQDLNSDGVLDASDPQLGSTTTFSGNDGVANFFSLAHAIAAGSSTDVLVVLDLPTDAADNDTFQVSLSAEDPVDAVTVLASGEERRVTVFGAPISGGTKTISSTGSLKVVLGPAAPPNVTAFPNSQNVPLLQLDLRASTAEGLRANELRLQTSGSGDDAVDVLRADLYLDVDSDGQLNLAVDQAIVLGATPAANDGEVVFSGLGQTIPAGGIVRWLVLYTLSGSANDGTTFRVDMASGSNLGVQGLTSLTTIVPTGPPVNTGATITVSRASLTLASGPFNAVRTATPGQSALPALQIRLDAGPAEPVLVSQLSVSSSGSGDEQNDLGAIRLWHDANGNGELDGGESQIGSPTAFGANDGTVTFSGFSREIAAGGSEFWLVTFDIANGAIGNDQFTAQVSGAGSVTVSGKDSSLSVVSIVPTIAGSLRTVTGSLALAAGANQPGAPNSPFPATNALVSQLNLAAGLGESVRVTSIVVAPSGTGNDQLGITTVDLILDANNNGTVEIGPDSVLQTNPYPGDDAPLTFSNAGGLTTITASSNVNLLLRYQLSNQGQQGQTFVASVDNAAILGEGVTSGLPINTGGAAVSNAANPVTLRRGLLTFAVGPENPAAGDILNGVTNVPVLQLSVVAGPGENVNVSSLKFTSNATPTAATTATVVAQARLYREGGGTRGVVDGSDVLLGTSTFNAGGEVTFTGAPLPTTFNASTTSYLLLVYDIAPGATAPATLTARLAAASDVTATGAGSGLGSQIVGAPAAGNLKTLRNGTLAAAVGSSNPPAGNTFPTSTDLEMLQVRVTAGFAETVRVTSVRLTTAGSANETTAVASLRLVHDTNADGIFTGGVDTLLGTTGAVPDNGTVTFGGLTLDIPPGNTANLLAVYNVANTPGAVPGTNLRLRVNDPAADILATGESSAQPIVTGGAAVEGNVKSIVLGSLALSTIGTNPGDTTVLPNASGIPMFQLQVVAGATESVSITNLTVTHTGTGDPVNDLTQTRLYHDSNSNGLLDADPLLASATFVGTSATFSIAPGTFNVAGSGTIHLLVVHEFNGNASNNETFRVSLTANANMQGRGNTSGVTITPSGTAPYQGGLKTVQVASLALAAGAGNPVAGNTLRNEANVEVLQVGLTAGAAEAVRVNSVRLTATAGGTFDLNAHVSQVRLYREQDPANGVLDGDALIGTVAGGFVGGVLTFALNPGDLEVPAGGTTSLLAVIDTNAPAGSAGNSITVRVAVNTDVTAVGVVSGLGVTPTGTASGNAHTVAEATLALAAGPNTPAASDVAKTQLNVETLQMRLTAGTAEVVRITSMTFTAAGTINPQSGTTQVRLYRDDNATGRLDGDTLLGTGAFGTNGKAAFTITPGSLDVSAGAFKDVLLVVDFGGTASDGQTLATNLAASAEVVATGLSSSLGVNPTGTATSASKTVREATLTVTAGVPPPPQTVFNNATTLRALHLRLQASTVDGVGVTQIVVRASGSANDTGVTARLFRDTNNNGVLDTGEPQLGSEVYGANDGAVTFTLAPGVLDVPVSQFRSVLVVYDLPATATDTQTYAARLASTADVSGTVLTTAAAATILLPVAPVQGPDITVQSTTLTVTEPTPQVAAGNVFRNTTSLPMIRFQAAAGTVEGVRVTQVILRPTAASTGPDTSTTVRLFVDVNTNGTLEVGTDTLVGTQTGNDTSVTFTNAGGLVDIPASGSAQFLAVYDLGAPFATPGQQFQLSVTGTEVTGQGLGSAAGVTGTGGPFQGGLKTVVQGTLALGTGANNPTAADVYGNQVRVMQQPTLTATNEALSVTQFVVKHTGVANPGTSVVQVRLYRDDNTNGMLDGDTLLATGTFTGNNATLSPTLSVPIGTVTLLVVYQFNTAAGNGDAFTAAAVLPADVTATGTVSGATITPTATSAAGGTQTFRLGSLNITDGANRPPPRQAYRNQGNVPVQQIRLTAASPGEPVLLQTLRITHAGTGAVGALTQARLYSDNNNDGLVDAGDTALQTRTFTGNNADFSGGIVTITPGSPLSLLVTYDYNATGANGLTHVADAVVTADVTATGVSSGLAIALSGTSTASEAHTLVIGQLAVQTGPAPPAAGRTVFRNQTNVPIQQVNLAATGEPVRLDTLRVTRAGTGAATAIALARLYLDTNNNGAVDAGDTQLDTATFTGNDATFSNAGGLATITTSTAINVLVAYDFNATGNASDTFGGDAVTTAPVDVTATGAASGNALTPTGSAAASNLVTMALGGLTIGDPGQPSAADVYRNQTSARIQRVRLTAAGETIRLNTFTVTHPGPVASVVQGRLYHDVNNDGLIDGGDLQLDARAFTGANVTFTQAGGLVLVTVGTPVELIVAYDFNGTAADAEVHTADAVATTDVTAVGAGSGAPPVLSGSAAASNDQTIRVGTLTIATGTFNPGASGVGATQTNVPVQQVRLTATGEPMRIASFTVGRAGAGTDGGVAAVRVYRDDNANGSLDGDTLLASGTFTTGAVTLGSGNLLTVSPGTPLNMLVTYDFSATNGETYGADGVATGDLSVFGAASGNAIVAAGAGAAGGLKTVAAIPIVTLTQTVPGDADIAPLQTGIVALRLHLTESSNVDGARLKALTVNTTGTALDQNAVKFVWLYRDVNNDGAVDGGDVQVGLTTYFADNGVAGFGGLNELVPQNGVLNLLVTYDMDDAAQMAKDQTLIASVQTSGDVTLVSDTGGSPIATQGTFPQTGRTLTVKGKLVVTAGPNNPSGLQQLRGGAVDVRMLQLDLKAELDGITVTALEVNASGTGDDPSGISSVTLYRDVDRDGLISGPDVVISNLAVNPFGANDGPATFTGLTETISAGTSARWMVVYGVAAVNTATHTYATSVLNASKITVSTGVVETTGFPLTGQTAQILGGVTLTLGDANPAGATLTTPQVGKEVFQVKLTADAAEDMQVSTVTISATGTANDTTSYTQTRLYLDDGDNVFEPAPGDDALIDAGKTFAADNGSLSFTLSAPQGALTKGTSKSVWYAVDVAGDPPAVPGANFRMRIAQNSNVAVAAAVTTSTLVSGAALDGQTFQTGSATVNLFAPATGTRLNNALTTSTTTPDLEVADFDRDGDPDVLALRGSGAFEILLGNGAGGFPTTSGDFATVGPVAPRRGAIGDIDNDGDVDLVIVSATAVQHFRNNGTATAFPGLQVAINAAHDYRDVGLIDFDRDGDLDIVATRTSGAANELARFRNDGGGTFVELTAIALTASLPPQDLAIGDINNDGIADVVLTDDGASTNVRVYTGDGATGFTLFATDTSPTTDARDVVVGLFNGDCFADVVVVDEGGAGTWYSALGSASGLTASTSAPTNGGGSPTGPRHLVTADFDRDAHLDIAIVHDGTDGLVAHLGNGLGAFPQTSAHTVPNPALNPDRLVVGDFDKDGDADLVLGSSTAAGRDVHRFDGNQTASASTVATPSFKVWGRRKPQGIAVGDFNCDGRPDYALFSPQDQLVGVFRQNADTTYTLIAEVAPTEKPDAMASAVDMNRDGKLDLVVASGGTPDVVDVFLGNGSGGFPTKVTVNALGGHGVKDLAVGDINNDGRLDVVVAQDTNDSFQVFRGSASTLDNALGGDQVSTGDNPTKVLLGDVNRDGKLDVLILAETAKQVWLHTGNGDFTFNAAVQVSLAGSVDLPGAFAIGDLDRDGDLDVAVIGKATSFIQVLEWTGAAFSAGTPFATFGGCEVLKVADLDQDGDLELISGDKEIITHANLGGLTFAAANTTPTDLAFKLSGIEVVDMNLDGDLDVIVAIDRSLGESQLFLGQ